MRWKQLKLVEKNKKAGKVKFLSAGYVPADENKMLSIGSENINDLIKTVIHNIDTAGDGNKLFQRRAFYDNLSKEWV